MQRFDGRQDGGGIRFPQGLIGVDVQFHFIAVRVTKVEALSHRMIAHALDRYSRVFQLTLGTAQVVQVVADFDADVVQPPSASRRRTGCIAHLDEQQLVMGPTRS